MKLTTPIVVKLKNGLTGTVTDFAKRRLTDQFEGYITGVTDTGETYTRKLKPRWDKHGICRDHDSSFNISRLNEENSEFFKLASTIKK